MPTPRALALCCLLQVGLALFVDQGCLVKPEWSVELAWPDTHISVWASPGHTATIFELQVHFKNTLKSFDRLVITPQEVKLERTRDIMLQEPLLFDFEDSSDEGWREYVFSVREDYALTSVRRKKTISMNATKGFDPGSVSVKGSNVTLNCQSRVRVWQVTAHLVTVPLEASGSSSLSVFSNQEVSPTFTLGKERFPLSWDLTRPGLVAGSHTGRALPRFVQHDLTLSCVQEGNGKSVCSVNTAATSGFQLYLNKYPRVLGVESRGGNEFYLLLQQDEAQILTCSCQDFAIAIYVLGAVLVLVILGGGIMAYCLVISKKNDRKRKSRDAENSAEELRPLNPNYSVSQKNELDRSSSAVMINDPDLELNYDCFQALVNNTVDKNVHIREALKIYGKCLDKVFTLASEGKYQNGVNVCLRQSKLMGTVRDEEGKSILHYIASCKSGNNAPAWTIPALRKFMKDHNCLPNAVDYEGRTCLHLLADAAETSNDEVSWDGETTSPREAWLRLAGTLLELGCDPRLTDGADRRPGDIARMKNKLELANCLEERCTKGMPQSKVCATHTDILNAVRRGDFSVLERNLCRPLLPLDAQADPLVEAVKSGKLRIVMLLLSAGAPICGLPLVSVTPLQASHMNPNLPAIFPALLRKEYASKLRYEAHSIPADPEGGGRTRNLIERLADDVESMGDKASWSFTKKSTDGSAEGEEARELLCAAAGFGLPLTCQMLALEGLQLHPLPRELNPVQIAYDKKQMDVLLVLLRDLGMSPFAIMDKIERSSLYKDIEALEFQKLQKFCRNTKTDYKSLVNQVNDVCTGKHRSEIDKKILLCISINGLVCLFHKIKTYVKDFNVVVDDLTGSTMLHIAATHNQTQMVECLLSNGADLHAKTKANLTALHLIASKGNRPGMEYLCGCIKSQGTETVHAAGISHQQLADGYEKLLEDFSMVLLPEEHALEILSLPYAGQKTKSLLQKKFQAMKISDNDSFFNLTKSFISRTESISDLVKEGENLLIETSKADMRFNGKLVPPTPSINALPEDSVQLYWEVDQQANVFYKEKAGNKYNVSVDLINKQQFTSCFRDEFQRAVEKTLKNYTFSCKQLWLSYPPVTKIDSGLTVFLTWFRNNRTRQVRMSLVPVIKTTQSCLPRPLPPLMNSLLGESVPNYLANYGGNYWKPVLAQVENHIYSKLSEEMQLVLVACKFITNVLYSCWWLPQGYRRRRDRSKHSFGVHLSPLRFRFLISLFLEEVSQSPRENWESSEFLDRILSTFKRATCLNNKGRRVPKKNLQLFLDSTNADQRFGNTLVCAIVEFLEEISKQS